LQKQAPGSQVPDRVRKSSTKMIIYYIYVPNMQDPEIAIPICYDKGTMWQMNEGMPYGVYLFPGNWTYRFKKCCGFETHGSPLSQLGDEQKIFLVKVR
jgi:hypothetical protein